MRKSLLKADFFDRLKPPAQMEQVASAYNECQQVEISLAKVLEQDDKFGIGMNGEIVSVQFGLYAAEDLTAADGKVIPKDGLL